MKRDKRKNEVYKGIDPEDVINDLMKSKDILIRNYILSNCVSVNVPLKNFMGEFEREMTPPFKLNYSISFPRDGPFSDSMVSVPLSFKIREIEELTFLPEGEIILNLIVILSPSASII